MGEDWLEGEVYSRLITKDSGCLMWLEVAATLVGSTLQRVRIDQHLCSLEAPLQVGNA